MPILVKKWVSALRTSHRFSLGIAGVMVSAMVAIFGAYEIELDESTQHGLIGAVATLIALIWADTQRPLAPRNDNGDVK